MHIKRLWRAGNSLCLVVPRDVLRELKLHAGEYVTIRTDHQGRAIIERLEATLARSPDLFRPAGRRDS